MRLYYMTNLETAQKYILPEWRMKLSTFDKVNDPFELLCADQSENFQRSVLKTLREHWIRRVGFICFSSNWESPLMWAHYADSHKGVCLGFDLLDEEKLQKMIYEPDRLKGLFDKTMPDSNVNEYTLMKVLTTKYKQWEYENEWRVFANLEDCDAKTGFYYVDLGPNFLLREVIVGANCAAPVHHLAKLVKESGKVLEPVTVIKARPAFQTFTMTVQKKVKTLVVKPAR